MLKCTLTFEDVLAYNSFPSSKTPFWVQIMNQRIVSPSTSGVRRAINQARENFLLLFSFLEEHSIVVLQGCIILTPCLLSRKNHTSLLACSIALAYSVD